MAEQLENHLSRISDELNQVSFKRQQLIDRRNVLALLIRFKKESGQNETEYFNESEELKTTEEMLEELSEKKIQLKKMLEDLNGPINPIVTTSEIIVCPPPSAPAPQVILDHKLLPPHPSPTQCPFCHQFITTDVVTKVGSVSYLVCLISIMLGCVAGCCLIPFCLDSCKDVIHKCPKCRGQIHTFKKL